MAVVAQPTTRRASAAGVRAFAAKLLTRGPLAGPTAGITTPPKGMGTRSARGWQTEAAGYYDQIGAIHYAHTYIGNACSKVVLQPRVMNPESGEPALTLDADDVGLTQSDKSIIRAAVDRLGDQSELNRLGCMNLSITGETLVTFQDIGGVDLIAARSVLEVKQQGSQIVLGGGPMSLGGGTELGPDDDVIRIWKTHPIRSEEADSWMRSVSDDCYELLLLNRQIRAQVQSRLATAGLLLLPTGLSLGPVDPTSSAIPPSLVEQLMETMARAISTPGDAAAVIPIILEGEGDLLAQVRFLVMEHAIDQVGAQQREEKTRAIAVAGDFPPEILTGKADLNHWTGAIVDDNTNSAHIQPLTKTWADGLCEGYLHAALRAAGMAQTTIDRIVLHPDATALVIRPNRAQDAKDAHTAMTISDESFRGYLGFTEDDAPTVEEIAQRIARDTKTRGDAPLTEALLQYLLPELTVDRAEPAGTILVTETDPSEPDPNTPQVNDGADPSTVPSEDAPAGGDLPSMPAAARSTELETVTIRNAAGHVVFSTTTPAADAHRRASHRLGTRLMNLDRNLRTRSLTAADAALGRALEKAGNKVTRKAQANTAARQALIGVHPSRAAFTLGRPMITSLGLDPDGLLGDDDWNDLADRFDDWAADAQEQALTLATGWLGLTITSPTAVAASEEQTTARTAARTFLIGAMAALAAQRLYDPSPDAPATGEHDTTMSVPVGTMRQALSIAGGNPSGLPDPDGTPIGEIGTGATISDLFTAQGSVTEGYTWSWGGSAVPFPPHEALDGVEFTDWSDAALTNDDGWPDALASPGDHSGCSCLAAVSWSAVNTDEVADAA